VGHVVAQVEVPTEPVQPGLPQVEKLAESALLGCALKARLGDGLDLPPRGESRVNTGQEIPSTTPESARTAGMKGLEGASSRIDNAEHILLNPAAPGGAGEDIPNPKVKL